MRAAGKDAVDEGTRVAATLNAEPAKPEKVSDAGAYAVKGAEKIKVCVWWSGRGRRKAARKSLSSRTPAQFLSTIIKRGAQDASDI